MTSHHQPSSNMSQRRLLSKKQVAQKFGYSSASWLDKHRGQLEQAGFPPPVLGPGFGTDLRWDEFAIDQWLDSRQAATGNPLKSSVVSRHNIDPAQIERQLTERAERLSL